MQKLMHQLKYKGKKEIGIFLGNLYGKEFSKAPLFNTVEFIIPVPMHPKKQKKRGYNQSEIIAIGLSQSMNVPVDTQNTYKDNQNRNTNKKIKIQQVGKCKRSF